VLNRGEFQKLASLAMCGTAAYLSSWRGQGGWPRGPIPDRAVVSLAEPPAEREPSYERVAHEHMNSNGHGIGTVRLVAICWVAFGVLYSTALALLPQANLIHAVSAGFSVMLPNCVFGVVLSRWVAQRWARGGDPRSIWTLLVLVVTAVMGTASWQALAWGMRRLAGQDFALASTMVLAWQTLSNASVHAAIVGVLLAVRRTEDAIRANQRAAEAESVRARAELALLRSQLNPHFFLNLLHAFRGLVRRDPALAESSIEKLGDVLRFGLSLQSEQLDEVTLGEELSFTSKYLALERLRFGKRLRCDIEADRALSTLLVPAFSILPLVENAVVHGISKRPEGGSVSVSAQVCGPALRIVVTDNGVGCAERDILTSPRSGLRLLRSRLVHLYDGSAELAFASPVGGGLSATLTIPLSEAA
jgi:Histidine kinase